MSKTGKVEVPGYSVVVIVDKNWASIGAIRMFLGQGNAIDIQMADELGGLIIAGKLLTVEDFPGVTLETEAQLLGSMVKDWRIFIPWQYVLAIFSHPEWTVSEIKKQIGFATAP